jgi:hypothetical protein
VWPYTSPVPPAHAHMTQPVMTADRHCRLLGVSVASAPSAAYVWALTLQQLRATMHLAAIKTTFFCCIKKD